MRVLTAHPGRPGSIGSLSPRQRVWNGRRSWPMNDASRTAESQGDHAPMSGSLLIGVDIGTASSKGVLTTPDGEVLASAVVAHETSFPRPGWAEHDADAIWWGEFGALCRELTAGRYTGADVCAVAVRAVGPCMLPLDATGTPLRPAILYGIDTRATAEIDLLNAQLGPDAIFAHGGMALTSQTMGPKILWLRRNAPDLFARTAMVHSSSDYIVSRLTGEHVMDRHTASYFAPLFNIETLAWDDRFADAVIGIDRLPRLGDATDIAGTITPAASAETGLPAGTPVTFGTIDAAAEAVSVGVRHPGDTMIMYGSTMFFLAAMHHPRPDPRMWTPAHPLPGLRSVTCGMATSGLLTTWVCDVMAGHHTERDAAFEELIAAATATPPGAEGLICLPYFAGERTPLHDPDARGIFAGLTLRHTRPHIFRATLEGIAFGARHNIEVMAEMQATPQRLVAVGGGTKNPLWLQVISDITGIRQEIPERTIGASYGNAFMAGLGSGIIPGIDALEASWVRIVDQVTPNPAHAARYAELYAVYRDLYEHTKNDMHRLAWPMATR
jgi:xylulokinase